MEPTIYLTVKKCFADPLSFFYYTIANEKVGFLGDNALRYGTNIMSEPHNYDRYRFDGWFGGNYCGSKLTFTASDKKKYDLVFYQAD